MTRLRPGSDPSRRTPLPAGLRASEIKTDVIPRGRDITTDVVRPRKHEIEPGERWICGLGAALLLAFGGLAAASSGHRAATVVVLTLHAAICAAYLVQAWLFPRREKGLSAGVRTLVEVSLATLPIAIVAALESTGPLVAGQGIGGYYVAFALAASRRRPAICLLAGTIAAAEYAALHLALAPPGAGGALAQRLFVLLAVSIGAALALVQLRRTTRSTAESRQRVLEMALDKFASPPESRPRRPAVARRCNVTVLFCDLREFTFLCERERPEDVVELLNQVYEKAGAIVERNGGTIDKFLGDGMLALFGTPMRPQPEHACCAVRAAISMVELVRELRQQGGVWTHLAVGIGIDTGDVVLAPVGAKPTADVTPIGSPVNRAARLQSVASREDRRVIVSDATRAAVGARFRLVPLGNVQLKGFAVPEAAFYVDTTAAVDGSTPRAGNREAETATGASSITPPTMNNGLGGGKLRGSSGRQDSVESTLAQLETPTDRLRPSEPISVSWSEATILQLDPADDRDRAETGRGDADLALAETDPASQPLRRKGGDPSDSGDLTRTTTATIAAHDAGDLTRTAIVVDPGPPQPAVEDTERTTRIDLKEPPAWQKSPR